ncbi:tRNA (guanine-N(7)-)-methyltransferase isoform X1 [Molothrus ater]|uniref:tRNA (guanine-N(7)-)-methyltransferase isoform X1 n=1 Tax=Molothrus ater TaxID=84834 RepID=UPI00174941B5|nr:tRNA (guanine-N(7)-)-methyltransferase isoform X1 [Molothrus ater]
MAAAEEKEEEAAVPPQKRFYRQRAHSNPLADHTLCYPSRPQDMDWASLFPSFFPPEAPPGTPPARVEFADVGCGYGGLLVALSELFPRSLALGLELRGKVAAFTRARIRALRAAQPGRFGNVACVRGNAMKHLPHFFLRGQLSKLFFLFPDPHFKRTKHKWRIISPAMLAEYGFVLRPGGLVYTVVLGYTQFWGTLSFGVQGLVYTVFGFGVHCFGVPRAWCTRCFGGVTVFLGVHSGFWGITVVFGVSPWFSGCHSGFWGVTVVFGVHCGVLGCRAWCTQDVLGVHSGFGVSQWFLGYTLVFGVQGLVYSVFLGYTLGFGVSQWFWGVTVVFGVQVLLYTVFLGYHSGFGGTLWVLGCHSGFWGVTVVFGVSQ